MSALRKPIHDPEDILTPAERAFCEEFIASVRLKPTDPAYWARGYWARTYTGMDVRSPERRELSYFDPTIW